jgi:hypothetical protein
MSDRSAPCGCDESAQLRAELAYTLHLLRDTEAGLRCALKRLDALLEDTPPPVAISSVVAPTANHHLANSAPSANQAELTSGDDSKRTDVQDSDAAPGRKGAPQ